MKRNNRTLLLEKEFLDSLVEDESACVEIQEKQYDIALHPFHLNNINESLKDILNLGIGKYDKKLDGILLGYRNIKVLSQSGAVANDSFFMQTDIAASFCLFKPEVGKILLGTVNKKSKDHVACLVHKIFNISLPKPEDSDDTWMGTNVEIGQDILFRITFINLEGRLPYIKAEFVSILGEQDSGISTSEENAENTINKKPKKIIFEDNSEDEEPKVVKKKHKKRKKEQDSDIEYQEKKRKKHKTKVNEEEPDSLYGNVEEVEHRTGTIEPEVEEETSKKKRKKSKYQNASCNDEINSKNSSEHNVSTNQYEEEVVASNNKDGGNDEKIKKKKKSKHKQDEVTSINLESNIKKKKKSKSKDSLADLTSEMLQRTLSTLSESKDDQHTTHRKKDKSRKTKVKDENDDFSSLLPDLNLSQLFSNNYSGESKRQVTFQMADNEDKILKKRRSSISHLNVLSNTSQLTIDSDLENIIGGIDNYTHKREGGDESSTKKRRRSSSTDDFVPKKKHKKHL